MEKLSLFIGKGIAERFPSRGLLHAVFLCAGFLLTNSPVFASIVDLTAGPGSSGTINGALFAFGNEAGGTGVLAPFVRLRASGTEEGYNTSNSNEPFDEKTGSWTHDLLLGEIPIITIGGVDFFEFILDTNESGRNKRFISLDDIKIYTSTIGSQNTTNIDSLGIKRYDMDALEDSHVRIDSSFSPGSGRTDMTAFIPVSLFAGASATDFVYFYSHFGGQGRIGEQRWETTGGFEEWAVQIDENSVFIPSPGVTALALLSLIIGGGGRRRRRVA